MAEYDIGEAFLQIVPSFDGFVQAVSREAQQAGADFSRIFNDTVRRQTDNTPLGPSEPTTRRQGDKSGGEFAASFKARVSAALAALPPVRIGVAADEAEQKLRDLRIELEDLSRQRIGIDLNEAEAIAKIDRIKADLTELGASSESVSVKMDTAAATAQLDRLRAEIDKVREVPVHVRADITEATEKIADVKRQMDELRQKRIGIDISETEALAELGRLKTELDDLAARSPSVQVKSDTAEASAQLAAIKAQIDGVNGTDARINVDDGGSASRTSGDLLSLQNLLVSLGPAVIPVGAEIAAALASVATGAVAALAGVGVLTLGLSGVSGAVKLLGQQQTQSAAAAVKSSAGQVSSANQIASAQLSLADTERRVANDRISSAQSIKTAEAGVTTAEQNLVTAQKASLQAQKDLTAARDAATRSLQDQAFAVQDAALQLKQDQLAVTQAQQNLATVDASPLSTDLQKQQAALQLAQAQQALTEQQVTLARATTDNNAAQKAGVAGSAQVVSAQQKITQAAQSQAQAQKAVQTAEQQLANARRAASQQAAQDASDLKRAQMALAQAQQASTTSQSGNNAALAATNAQLAKVNPATLVFAKYVRDTLEPAFNKLKSTAAAGLLPGVEAGLNAVLPLMPMLNKFVGNLASTLGGLAAQAGKALNSPFWKQFFGYISDTAGPLLHAFGVIIGNLAMGFAGLLEAFAPVTQAIVGGVESMSRSFADFATGKGSSALHDFIGYVKDNAAPVVDLFRNLVTVAGRLIVGLAPLGSALIKVIDAVSKLLAKLSPNELLAVIGGAAAAVVYLGVAFAAIPTQITAIVVAVTAVAALIVANWSKIRPVVQPVLTVLQDIWRFVVTKLVPVLAGIFQDALDGIRSGFATVTRAVQGHRAQLAELVNAFKDVVGFVVTKVLPIFGPILKASFQLTGQLIRALIDVIAGLVEAFNRAVSFARTTGRAISNAWNATFSAVSNAWASTRDFLTGSFSDFAKTAGKLWNNIAGAIGTAFGAVRSTVSKIWDDVKTVFASGVNFVTQKIIDPLIGVLNDVLGVFGIKIHNVPAVTIPSSASSGSGTPGKSNTNGGAGGHYFATGGVLPGYTPGTDGISLPRYHFSGGEGILVPEATRALGGVTGIQRINSMFTARVSPPGHFAGGGTIPGGTTVGGQVVGGLGSFLGSLGQSAVSTITGALSGIKDAIRRGAADAAVAGLKTAEAPLRAVLGLAPSSLSKQLGGGALDKINAAVFDYIRGHVKAPASGGGGAVPTGSHVELIRQALGLARVADNAANEAAVNTIVVHESGWNPKAINLTDSNAQAGHPSQGLMQTIPSTFEAYRLKSLPDVITNPLANLVAGIRYAVSRYGSLPNVPGVRGVANGSGYVGYDSGGFLPPGVTTVFNGTGKPEPVFTSQQFAEMTSKKSAGPVLNVYPAATLDEVAVGTLVARQLKHALATL